MDKNLKVAYSNHPAPAIWGASSLLSFAENRVCVHISNEHTCPLRTLQIAARQLAKLNIGNVTLHGEHWTKARQWAFYQGFQSNRHQQHCTFNNTENQSKQLLTQRADVFSKVRQLVNGAPNHITPQQLTEIVILWLSELAGDHISSEIISGDSLDHAGWQGIYQVGRGSSEPPAMLHIDFNPTKDPHAPTQTVLVGKGITFDSGGYSMKRPEAMAQMKLDMAGAATLTGALALAIMQGLSSRTRLILCLAENMVSGNALRLGDIIHYKNNVSVEVLNTDAEGRLVLADGLLKASEYDPELIIDAATLTGASLTAVGTDYTALFGFNHQLCHDIIARGKCHNELFWQLPLDPWHRDQFAPTTQATTANSKSKPGGGYGAASAAAGFLSRFVADHNRWVHLDLANAYQLSPTALWATGATGNSVLTLASLLLNKNI